MMTDRMPMIAAVFSMIAAIASAVATFVLASIASGALQLQHETIQLQRESVEMQREIVEMQRGTVQLQQETVEMQRGTVQLQQETVEMQGETLLNSVYPEIELVGWDFEPRIETNPDMAQLTIKSIVNLGTGLAKVIYFGNIELEDDELPEDCKSENAFTAMLASKRVLILRSGDEQELGNFIGHLSWKCANTAFLKSLQERVLHFTFSVRYRDIYENTYEKVWRVRATEKNGNESSLGPVAEMMDSPLDKNRHLYLTHSPLIKRNGIELGDLVVQGR